MLYRLAVWFALPVAFVMAQTSTGGFSVVNGASYGGTVAPEGWATIFGSNLAGGTATATLDANGQLPTQLASTSVEFNGVAAALYYVSPAQINLVVPAGLSEGTATVVVRTAVLGSTKTTTATVAVAIDAPGVFTSDSSGKGAGAILNAVTGAAAPFLVQTAENGPDTRTRLAVYGTGLRNAKSVAAQAQDPSGNTYILTVEYAGAAPGFFGLDQVNLLLPEELDVAGSVSLTLYADRATANVVTLQMSQIPLSALRVSSLTLAPTFVTVGDPATLTVKLTGRARSGGYVVGLKGDSIAQVTPQVTIAEGLASGTAAVSTGLLTGTGTITAQSGGATQSVTLEVDALNAAVLTSLALGSTSTLGGRTVTGTVTLAATAPSGGVKVTLVSDNAVAVAPANVTVPFGQKSATFPVTTTAVTAPVTATVSATLNHVTTSAALLVNPAMQLTLSASTIVGGNSLSGTVTLGDPAPAGGVVLSISSSDLSAARVGTAAMAAGQNVASFTITTNSVLAARTVTITVTYGALTQSASLSVTPPPVPALSAVTISPSSVTAGQSATGTVTLTGAATAGTTVSLGTSSGIIAAVSNSVVVAQGQVSAQFNISTVAKGVATITATLNGVKQTATITVQ